MKNISISGLKSILATLYTLKLTSCVTRALNNVLDCTYTVSHTRTKSISDSGVKLRRKSSDFPRLLLRERETGRHVTVREKVLGERRTGTMVTEVYLDEATGEEVTRTVELVEKTVEHEVNFQRRVEHILHCTLHYSHAVVCTPISCARI